MICPDARLTDATKQALALVRHWAKEYRVHMLVLSTDGPLLAAIESHATTLWGPDRPADPAAFAEIAVAAIAKHAALAFAVTVSVDARSALAPLRHAGVPSLAMIAELASRCVPVTAVSATIAVADQVVVPARLVLDDAMATDYLLGRGRHVHVLAPGDIALLPFETASPAKDDGLRGLLRPDGVRRDIVLGTGSVCHSSGVDLFLEVARAVLARPEGRDALFVWSGPGFDPRDGGYGAHLLGQLRCEGLENRVLLLPEILVMDVLYDLADIVLVPGRADALSAAGLSAMLAGRAVVCFEGASGLAEHLGEEGISDPCVVGYLDVAQMASRVLALLAAPDWRRTVAGHCGRIAQARFEPNLHARAVASLARNPRVGIEDDLATICASPQFDPIFCLGSDGNVADRPGAALRYLEASRTGLAMRKPEPGFHPGIFAEAHPGSDPYATFLRLGRPPGPWRAPVILGNPGAPIGHPSDLRAALHIHAYYPDQMKDIAARLACNTSHPDLFVSVTDVAGQSAAGHALADYPGAICAIEVVPNVGRDIGPLLTAFGPRLVDEYEVVGHVHTKKSGHAADADMVRRWVELTLSGVLGSARAGGMMDRALAAFDVDARLGLIHPEDPNVFGWTANRLPALRLLEAMDRGPAPDAFNFPVGTMFWMRAAALRPFVQLALPWEAYPAEPLANDGTMLHALERLFGVVPRLDGWNAAVTVVPGIWR